MGRLFYYTMNKKHTYVECQGCNWRLENSPDHDWKEHPCRQCNNTRQVIDPREILCNLCGETMCPLGTHNEQYPHGLYKAKVTGGYDSYHLFDMTRYTFSFCEKCLRQLFVQCKIKPDLADMDFDGNATREELWEQDQEAYEYRVWKDEGGYHQAYLDRKCNFKKDCPNEAVYTQLVSGDFTEGCCCEEHKELFGYSNSKLTKFITNVFKPFL
jgi:hypothetical protein